MRTPFLRREAGSLTNRTVTIRTIPDFKHPRTGRTAVLLSTTTELFVINLVAQHDPESNPEFASGGGLRFPQSFLDQLAPVEPL